MSNLLKNKINILHNDKLNRLEMSNILIKEFNNYVEEHMSYNSNYNLIDDFLLQNYTLSLKQFLANFDHNSKEWFNFWYEFFYHIYNSSSYSDHDKKLCAKCLNQIHAICHWSLWKIIEQNNEHEIIPFEETEIVDNDVDDIYDLFLKYRNSKNINEKIINIKPIIDLVIDKVGPKHKEIFDNIYSEDELLKYRNMLNAVRHAQDNQKNDNNEEYRKYVSITNKVGYINRVYFVCIEIFAFLNRNA
ncbi:MAG: hypothetical protein LBP70_03575 [Mycoplasmataceae bacterium]|jgi:hypothetical protein|nr:hypothetical protein [Mycoplasmataceae bacterium]